MPRCALLLAAGIFAAMSAAAAEDAGTQVWLNPGSFSHHFKDDREYREKNYGLGVEAFITPRHGLTAGAFMNSNDERSRYVGYHWRPLQVGPSRLRFSAGLVLALVDGYSDIRDGDTFPTAAPSLSLEYRALGMHLLLLPRADHSGALALQFRLRVW
jgi:hypothetical protein